MRQLMMHSAGHTEIATATTAIGAGGAGATDKGGVAGHAIGVW